MKLPFAALAASLVCLIVAPVFAQTTPAQKVVGAAMKSAIKTCVGADGSEQP